PLLGRRSGDRRQRVHRRPDPQAGRQAARAGGRCRRVRPLGRARLTRAASFWSDPQGIYNAPVIAAGIFMNTPYRREGDTWQIDLRLDRLQQLTDPRDPSPLARRDLHPDAEHYILDACHELPAREPLDRKSTRLNSSHVKISYAVFCLKKKI